MTAGRPSDYTPEIAERICEEIAGSEYGLDHICEENDEFPSARTVYRWLEREENEDFRQKYARARELQAELHADMILAIADDSRNDFIENSKEGEPEWYEFRGEHVQRSKLRVDARKWKASKLAPKKYGDRITHAGDEENPVVTKELSDLDYARRTAFVLQRAKRGGAGAAQEGDASKDE